MLLTLSVISAQGPGLGSSAYRVFDTQGGTIGRIDANDWVLPDPAKFVSSHHARIRCHNNVFYLQDISTNGTFLNSTESPVSKSDMTALGDGDRILIGDYEILVQLIDDGTAGAPEPVPPAIAPLPAAWPLSTPTPTPTPTPARVPATLAAAPLPPPLDDEPPEISDPLLLLGGGGAPPAPSPAPALAAAPAATPLVPPPPLAPRAPPAASAPPTPPVSPGSSTPDDAPPGPGVIPDDWQLTGFNVSTPAAPAALAASTPAPARAVATPAPRAPLAPPPAPVTASPSMPPPPRAPAAIPPATMTPAANPSAAATLPSAPKAAPPSAPPRAFAPGTMDERLVSLLNGLGVDPERVSPETFSELGEILRVVVQGLIDVLQSRTEVKNNFRVPMTTMRPVENNPLKFSLNVDDAIHNLFVKRNPGYLQPVDAFREGFRDVAFHQVAMLAGIRTAFNSLYARFEPATLEETFERKLKRTMLLGMATKLKYWDAYCEQFEDFDKDAEATFQNLFGEDFAKAYFDQLQKLATTARARKR